MFGLVEGLTMACLAIGSILVAILVAVGGPTTALVGMGAILPVIALLSGRTLLALDRKTRVPVVEIGLLRSIELFAPLPAPEVEGLARALTKRVLSAGEVIIRQGATGDSYYAVADGVLRSAGTAR